MHPLLDVRPWPRVLLRYPLLVLTACLLGALCAFAYSYAPLHRAKDWRIDYLEDRLEVRNTHLDELETEIADAHRSLEGQPSGEEMKALRAQLGEATKLAASREREIRDLDGKLERMEKSRNAYKRRHASATAELKEAKSARAAAPPSQEKTAVAATGRPATTKSNPPESGTAAADSVDIELAVPASPAPVQDDTRSSRDRIED